MSLSIDTSVADPFHFDMDLDPFREITDPDPADQNETDPNGSGYATLIDILVPDSFKLEDF